MTGITVFVNNNVFYVDYIDNTTGEVLTVELNKLDVNTCIEVCRQFEIATGIDCDYRNI